MATYGERYALRVPLGESAVGSVWNALDKESGQQVAILRLEDDVSDATRARFRDQARRLLTVNHPNVVRAIDQGDAEDGSPYLVVELLEGETLAAHWAHAPLAVEHAVEIVRGAAEGLNALHAAGITHGAIEPGNLFLVGAKGQEVAKLIGIALNRASVRGASDDDEPRTSLTTLHQAYAYAAPEQLRGTVDSASVDLYSLGAVLYAALAGRPPHVAPNLEGLLAAVVGARPPRLATLNRDLTSYSSTMERALSAEPAKRFQDGMSFSRALKVCLAMRRGGAAAEVPAGPRSPIGAAPVAAPAAASLGSKKTIVGGFTVPKPGAMLGAAAPSAVARKPEPAVAEDAKQVAAPAAAVDAEQDATPEAAVDAEQNATPEAAVDAEQDATPEAAVDAKHPPAPEAAVDAKQAAEPAAGADEAVEKSAAATSSAVGSASEEVGEAMLPRMSSEELDLSDASEIPPEPAKAAAKPPPPPPAAHATEPRSAAHDDEPSADLESAAVSAPAAAPAAARDEAHPTIATPDPDEPDVLRQRPAWVIPAAIAAVVLLALGAWAAMRKGDDSPETQATNTAPAAPEVDAGIAENTEIAAAPPEPTPTPTPTNDTIDDATADAAVEVAAVEIPEAPAVVEDVPAPPSVPPVAPQPQRPHAPVVTHPTTVAVAHHTRTTARTPPVAPRPPRPPTKRVPTGEPTVVHDPGF